MTTKTKRIDAATLVAFVAEQLAYRKKKLLDKALPPFRALQLLPISREAPPGAETVKQTMFSPEGMAAFVAANSDDIPDVTVVADEHFVPVREMADKFDETRTEYENAALAGVNLSDKKMSALVLFLDKLKNQVAWFGDAVRGLFGLLTHPNTNKIEAENGSWNEESDPMDIIEDVNLLVHESFVVTNGVENLEAPGVNGKVVFPHSVWPLLNSKSVSAQRPDYSIMDKLKKDYPTIEFTYASELNAVAVNPRTGGAGPVKCAVAFQALEEKVSLEVPLELDILDPQYINLKIRTIGRAKTAGVMSSFPMSITIMDGL